MRKEYQARVTEYMAVSVESILAIDVCLEKSAFSIIGAIFKSGRSEEFEGVIHEESISLGFRLESAMR